MTTTDRRRCPGCSNESPRDLPFCASCGLLFEAKRCTSCNAEWQGDLAYCASCGADPASAWANEAPPAPVVTVEPPPPLPSQQPSQQPNEPALLPPMLIGNPPPPRPQFLDVLPEVPPGMRVCHRCGRLESGAHLTSCTLCGMALPPHAQPWRAALSTDPVEHEFLATLRARPADTAARMVYADWLEQRGDAARATYVRTHERGQPVADRPWRAIVSRLPIGLCNRSECPRHWDELDPDPTDERARHCRVCDQTVSYCGAQFSKAPIVLDFDP